MSFEQIQTDLRELDGKIDNLTTQVATYAPKVEKCDREVFGNGRPSLSTQIAEVKATQKLALKVLGGIGGAGLAMVGAIAVKLLFFGL